MGAGDAGVRSDRFGSQFEPFDPLAFGVWPDRSPATNLLT